MPGQRTLFGVPSERLWYAWFMYVDALALLLALSLTTAAEDDAPEWGGFRGNNGTGVAASSIPDALDPEGNLMWRIEVPAGYSSPTIVGDRLFITGAEGSSLWTICMDRFDGTEVWRQEVGFDGKRPGANSPAAPSPATDGVGVYSVFHSFGIVAYDLEGNKLWEQEIGPFNIPHGMSSSPVVHGEMVMLQVDQDRSAYLVAYDRRTGKERWKVERPGVTHSYATPAVYAPEGKPAQLIVSGSFQIASYAVESGEKLWWVDGSAWQTKSVPVIHADRCYINAFMQAPSAIGLPKFAGSFEDILAERDENGDGLINRNEWEHEFLQMAWFIFDLDDDDAFGAEDWEYAVACGRATGGLFAIDLGGEGDVGASHVDWKFTDRRSLPEIPSPVFCNDTIFLIAEGGIFTSIDPESGEEIKQGRVAEPESYFASPVSAGGRIVLASKSGQLSVIRADAEWELLSTHRIDEEVWSTPAIAGGQVFIRSQQALYCFEGQSED